MDSQANIDKSPSSSFSSVSSNDETSQTRTATLRNSYSSNDIDDSENESPQRIKSIDLASTQHTEYNIQKNLQHDLYPFRKCHSVVHLTSKEIYKNSIAKCKYRHTIQIPLTESSIKLSLSAQKKFFNVIKRDNYLSAHLIRFFNSCKVNTIQQQLEKHKTKELYNFFFLSLLFVVFIVSFVSRKFFFPFFKTNAKHNKG